MRAFNNVLLNIHVQYIIYKYIIVLPIIAAYMIIEKAANAVNDSSFIIKVHRCLPYLVTPLYMDAPLENPLLFLYTHLKKTN